MPVPPSALAEYQAIIQKFKAQSKQGHRERDQGGGGSSGLEMISALRQLTSLAKVLWCRGLFFVSSSHYSVSCMLNNYDLRARSLTDSLTHSLAGDACV
jgi:hypothetical protein